MAESHHLSHFLPRHHVPNRYLVSNQLFQFQFTVDNARVQLYRNGETAKPEYLKCTLRSPGLLRSAAAREHLFDNLQLRMQIGGLDVWHISLKLLAELKAPVIMGATMYLDLQFDMFFPPLPVMAMDHHDVVLDIIGAPQRFTEVQLGCQYEMRARGSTVRSIDSDVQQLHTTRLTHIGSHEIRYSLDCSMATKGFFVLCRDIQELMEVDVQLLGQTRIHYTPYEMQRYCTRVSDCCLYVGFNPQQRYDARDSVSFEGGLMVADNPLGSVQVKITFAATQETVSISLVLFNVLRVMAGMGGLGYVDGTNRQFFDLRYEDYQRNHYQAYGSGTELSRRRREEEHEPTAAIDRRPTGTSDSAAALLEVLANAYNQNTVSETREHRWIADAERRSCCISLEDIQEGDSYIACGVCANHFLETVLLRWINSNMGHRRACPTCRSAFVFPLQIYVHLAATEGEGGGTQNSVDMVV